MCKGAGMALGSWGTACPDPSGVGQAGKAQDDGRWARGELKLQEEIDEDGEKIDKRDYKHTESKR